MKERANWGEHFAVIYTLAKAKSPAENARLLSVGLMTGFFFQEVWDSVWRRCARYGHTST